MPSYPRSLIRGLALYRTVSVITLPGLDDSGLSKPDCGRFEAGEPPETTIRARDCGAVLTDTGESGVTFGLMAWDVLPVILDRPGSVKSLALVASRRVQGGILCYRLSVQM